MRLGLITAGVAAALLLSAGCAQIAAVTTGYQPFWNSAAAGGWSTHSGGSPDMSAPPPRIKLQLWPPFRPGSG